MAQLVVASDLGSDGWGFESLHTDMNNINWHEELTKRNFLLLEESTKTYGNGKFTGSICYEKWDGKFFTIVEEMGKNVSEIFCPFLHGNNPNRPNKNYQTVRLRNTQDLDEYLLGSYNKPS